MKNYERQTKLALVPGFLICAQPSNGQTLTKESYERARDVLDKAVAAYGGLENLRSIENFTIKISAEMVL